MSFESWEVLITFVTLHFSFITMLSNMVFKEAFCCTTFSHLGYEYLFICSWCCFVPCDIGWPAKGLKAKGTSEEVDFFFQHTCLFIHLKFRLCPIIHIIASYVFRTILTRLAFFERTIFLNLSSLYL